MLSLTYIRFSLFVIFYIRRGVDANALMGGLRFAIHSIHFSSFFAHARDFFLCDSDTGVLRF